jgi:hypothetical protein
LGLGTGIGTGVGAGALGQGQTGGFGGLNGGTNNANNRRTTGGIVGGGGNSGTKQQNSGTATQTGVGGTLTQTASSTNSMELKQLNSTITNNSLNSYNNKLTNLVPLSENSNSMSGSASASHSATASHSASASHSGSPNLNENAGSPNLKENAAPAPLPPEELAHLDKLLEQARSHMFMTSLTTFSDLPDETEVDQTYRILWGDGRDKENVDVFEGEMLNNGIGNSNSGGGNGNSNSSSTRNAGSPGAFASTKANGPTSNGPSNTGSGGGSQPQRELPFYFGPSGEKVYVQPEQFGDEALEERSASRRSSRSGSLGPERSGSQKSLGQRGNRLLSARTSREGSVDRNNRSNLKPRLT